MKIKQIEIQNFRKLKSTHIDLDDETTLLVGANNSGKTSAMLALRYFLVSPSKLSFRDITVANWTKIDAVGSAWENGDEPTDILETLLPTMDVWLDVPLSEIHHVVHILPTINWCGGLIGVRLKYQPEKIEKLKADYIQERTAAKTMTAVGKGKKGSALLHVWPSSLSDFLEERLAKYLEVQAYALDPTKFVQPEKGVARPQALMDDAVPLDKHPFKSLIKINEIAAQREFTDAGGKAADENDGDKSSNGSPRFKRKLSDQLRAYYDRHLDPEKKPTEKDYEALCALQDAEKSFDARLKESFKDAFRELKDLVGYPGIGDPNPKISTQLRATDGLMHGSAVQYEVVDPTGDGSRSLHLPEDYSGLGYQNLISMVFMLMSFRDGWMRVGKKNSISDSTDADRIQPLHLVLTEEPEAHLHAQVQQVFIKNAYTLLRNHEDLGKKETYSTQLVVSTHSSHIAHEVDFANLRYFRRRQAAAQGETATTTVANLSFVFGTGDETQRFVKRYLKATHCDLFFADGVIFVEGQAERILVPHFIQHHFDALSRRYVTLLDIGGSHVHRFKSLIDELGLSTLIIADLDAAKSIKVTNMKNVEATVWKAAKPEIGQGQKTANSVLKDWHPAMEKIDDLLAQKPDGHIAPITDVDGYDLYVAYQKAVSIPEADKNSAEAIPRTFEDALVLANIKLLSKVSGLIISKKIETIVDGKFTGEELADELFEWVKDLKKAEFAIDCLMIDKPKSLIPPPYIQDGLSWLQRTLDEKTMDAPRKVPAK